LIGLVVGQRWAELFYHPLQRVERVIRRVRRYGPTERQWGAPDLHLRGQIPRHDVLRQVVESAHGHAVGAGPIVMRRALPFTLPCTTQVLLEVTPDTRMPRPGVALPSAQYNICLPDGSGAASAATVAFGQFDRGHINFLGENQNGAYPKGRSIW
jgi:hypothetical protein